MKSISFLILTSLLACSQVVLAQVGVSTEAKVATNESNVNIEAQAAVSTEALTWDTKRHNKGTRAQYDDFEVEYTFTNNTSEPIVILEASVTCECTTTYPPKAPILPGQQGVIKAHFDSKLLGKFKKPIRVTHTGEDKATILFLECEILEKKE